MKLTNNVINTWKKEGFDCCVIYNLTRDLYLQYTVTWSDLWKGETELKQFGYCYELEYAKPFNFYTAIQFVRKYSKYCNKYGEEFRVFPFKKEISKWTEKD